MADTRDRARRLEELSIELTSKCNLTCGMCSVWKGMRDGIPRARVFDLLAEARRLGATRFTPSGAEVFMRKDTVSILEEAARLGFRSISVVTNGMLIKRHIKRLRAVSGLSLHVSIDGAEGVHDALRGPGSYRSALEGLRASVDAGIPTSVKAVVMRPTLASLTHLVDLAVDHGLPRISVQPFQPEIAGPDEDHGPWQFTPDARGEVTDALSALLDYARLAGIEVFTEALFPHIPPYLFDNLRPIPEGGCFLPSRFVLIDGRGETYPCFFMRGQSMGNVMRGVRLSDIWHGPVQRRMQTIGIKRTCPGCLAGCSDVESFDEAEIAATSSRQAAHA
ncbi:MAG: radical SAM protein [Pseudomonadota bacterium]